MWFLGIEKVVGNLFFLFHRASAKLQSHTRGFCTSLGVSLLITVLGKCLHFSKLNFTKENQPFICKTTKTSNLSLASYEWWIASFRQTTWCTFISTTCCTNEAWNTKTSRKHQCEVSAYFLVASDNTCTDVKPDVNFDY